MLLKNKRVLITGGSTGIGRASVVRCVQEGARVVFADINEDGGKELEERLNGDGHDVKYVRTDVSKGISVKNMVGLAAAHLGGIDGLLAAAAIANNALVPVEVFSDEQWLKHVDTNLTGIYYTSKHAAAVMKKGNGGVMVFVASGAGVKSPSSLVAYGATKGGVHGFGMTLENQLEKDNIRVNVLCPGNIETPLKLDIIDQQVDQIGSAADKSSQIKELGDPRGVASIIVFLLSGEADYVRGALFTR